MTWEAENNGKVSNKEQKKKGKSIKKKMQSENVGKEKKRVNDRRNIRGRGRNCRKITTGKSKE